MNLPYNLTLLPGVRTDAKGRPYQVGRYPSGKTVTVYVENDLNVPWARMIPVPKEPVRQPKKLMTTGLNGEKKPVVFIPRRLMKIEYRFKGEKTIRRAALPNEQGEETVKELRCHAWTYTDEEGEKACRERDTGSIIPCIEGKVDWMIQWHDDEEVK